MNEADLQPYYASGQPFYWFEPAVTRARQQILANTAALENPYSVNQVSANVPPPATPRPTPGVSGKRTSPVVNGSSAVVYNTGQPREPMPAPRRNIRPFTAELTPGKVGAKPPANQAHTEYGTDYDEGMPAPHANRGTTPATQALTWAEAQRVLDHAKAGCQLCRGFAMGLNAGMATLRDTQARAAQRQRTAAATTTPRGSQRLAQAHERR
jgi:hypothetical protein